MLDEQITFDAFGCDSESVGRSSESADRTPRSSPIYEGFWGSGIAQDPDSENGCGLANISWKRAKVTRVNAKEEEAGVQLKQNNRVAEGARSSGTGRDAVVGSSAVSNNPFIAGQDSKKRRCGAISGEARPFNGPIKRLRFLKEPK